VLNSIHGLILTRDAGFVAASSRTPAAPRPFSECVAALGNRRDEGKTSAWRARLGSNQQPLASEASTLSIELRAQGTRFYQRGSRTARGEAQPTARRTRRRYNLPLLRALGHALFCVPRGTPRIEDSMSDAHADHDLPHEGPIKTPKQLLWAVVAAFVVPIIAILLLVNYVVADKMPAAGSTGLNPEAVAQRIQPVGKVEIKDLNDPASLKTGEQVYTAQCVACHGAGVAGAPKLGDAEAWGPRLKAGYETLLASALKGKGSMGAQGGGDFSDLEIGRAVVYLANQAGGKFDEPKLAAAAAPAAAAPTTMPAATATAAPAAVAVAAAPAAAAKADAVPALYAQSCSVCHAAGVANAPKLGDKAAWAPRLAAGVDGLTASVIKGKGAMPPKGGSTASDTDIKTVVAYMVGTVK
jgi:cytochrome c5